MDEERVDALVKQISQMGHEVSQAKVRAELDVILAREFFRGLARLSADIQQAQTVLGTRLTELTAAIAQAANSSTVQAASLVRWTKWYVFATAAILAASVVGTVVTILKIK
jgi:hypothetical protein